MRLKLPDKCYLICYEVWDFTHNLGHDYTRGNICICGSPVNWLIGARKYEPELNYNIVFVKEITAKEFEAWEDYEEKEEEAADDAS